jgi:hypothetical protein
MTCLQIKCGFIGGYQIPGPLTLKAPLKCIFLLILVGITCPVVAQPGNAFYGKLLTRISIIGKSADTTRQIFCRNIADDKLSVFTIFDGVVSSATAYRLSGSNNELYLYSRSIDQQTTDSLKIDFIDSVYTVIINKHDRYVLYPNVYALLKNDVHKKHKITAIMRLLNDALGDYPIADALPLFAFQPDFSKQIRHATIVTKRSQSDLTDTWSCTYKYNRHALLYQIIAEAGKDIRYTKNVHYSTPNVTQVHTYLNRESRQIVNQSISYFPSKQTRINWQDDIYEPGKDRETKTSVTQIAEDLNQLQSMEPSFAEILSLLKWHVHNYKKTK